MEGTKTCSNCGLLKPLSEMRRNKKSKDGRGSLCSNCDREKCREYDRSGKRALSRQNNPKQSQLSLMLYRSRRRAEEKGLPHDLDYEYLQEIAPTHCPYSGVKLRWKIQTGSGIKQTNHPDSPSLDRIDSSKGYVKGNVAIVAFRANTIKNNATEQELIQMGRRIAQFKMQLAMPE